MSKMLMFVFVIMAACFGCVTPAEDCKACNTIADCADGMQCADKEDGACCVEQVTPMVTKPDVIDDIGEDSEDSDSD